MGHQYYTYSYPFVEQYIWLRVSQNEFSWQPTMFRRWICQTLSYSVSFCLWGILISAAMRFLQCLCQAAPSLHRKMAFPPASPQCISCWILCHCKEIIGKVTLPCLHRFLLCMAWVLLRKEVPKCRSIFGNSQLFKSFAFSLFCIKFLHEFPREHRSWSHPIMWLIMTLSAAGNEQHDECVVLGGNGSLFPFILLSNRMILLSFIVFIINYRHSL